MIEFVSKEGTIYLWEPVDRAVGMTPQELKYTQIKVRLMSDHTILNQVSGNEIQMGIPLFLNNERLQEVYRNYKNILSMNPSINITSHAIDRLTEDLLLSDKHPARRGWTNEDDIRECVRNMYQIIGLRLNVNHFHRLNTYHTKYLHPQIAVTLKGKKSSGDGHVVTAVINEKVITVITIL